MAPTPRSMSVGGAGGGRPAKPELEIIPDTRFVVFHGGEHEAQPVKLSGVVRLHTPEPISILKPKVRLEGRRRIHWWYINALASSEQLYKGVFWNEEQKLGVETAHKIKAGTIEWPFEFDLAPAIPESVEGLPSNYIAYHLCASVSRPGWNAKDLVAQQHIRIVRTLGQESMEMTRSRVNADVWANKISYSISIPTDAIVFGTSIAADVELSPLKKGIRLGKVELRLMETTVKRITQLDDSSLRADRQKTDEYEVAKSDMDFPEDSRLVYDRETLDNPVLADEMYKFKATLPLPKSLNVCRQDVDLHNINISHRFKLMVNIHNPEGHVSQLVCRLPVKLFISPNLPVDESNEVSPMSLNGATDAELNSSATEAAPPPEYGRHQLDQMYSDIDTSGFMSRAGSGPGTPAEFFAQSRRGSRDNCLSINSVADIDHSAHHGIAMPSLLHSRLADLEETRSPSLLTPPAASYDQILAGSTSPATSPRRDHNFSLSRSPSNRNPPATHLSSSSSSTTPHDPSSLSRRTSGEHEPEPASAFDMHDLTRVPSYGAALRTPAAAITPVPQGPPSYVEATSRPPSPVQRPTRAHLATTAVSSSSAAAAAPPTLASSASFPVSPPTATPTSPSFFPALPHLWTTRMDALRGAASSPSHSPSPLAASPYGEADARLRMLRART